MTRFVDPLHAQILRVVLLPWDEVAGDWQVVRDRLDLDTLWDHDAIRLLPLVHRALVAAGQDDPELPRLRGVVRRVWYDNLILFHRVAGALDALDAAGVRAMLLKGAPLALLCYPEIGLRPMADVDLLVEPAQATTAMRALDDAGWRRQQLVEHPDRLVPGEQMVHQVVYREEGGRTIDLHWRYVPWVARDGSGQDPGLWADAQPLELAGRPALAPAPDDLLLLVMLHAFRAGWASTPRWVADAWFVLQGLSASLDWDRFTHRVVHGHLVPPVRDALAFVAGDYGASVPGQVLRALRTARVAPWERHRHRVGSRAMTGERRALVGELGDARIGWARWSLNLTPAAAARSFPSFAARRLGLERPAQLPMAVARRGFRNVEAALRGRRQSASANS